MQGSEERWISLREIDEAAGQPKGTAFRRFKALAGNWVEGRDFWVLNATHDAGRIADLKSAGRLYRSTIHAVLLSPASAAEIRRDVEQPAYRTKAAQAAE